MRLLYTALVLVLTFCHCTNSTNSHCTSDKDCYNGFTCIDTLCQTVSEIIVPIKGGERSSIVSEKEATVNDASSELPLDLKEPDQHESEINLHENETTHSDNPSEKMLYEPIVEHTPKINVEYPLTERTFELTPEYLSENSHTDASLEHIPKPERALEILPELESFHEQQPRPEVLLEPKPEPKPEPSPTCSSKETNIQGFCFDAQFVTSTQNTWYWNSAQRILWFKNVPETIIQIAFSCKKWGCKTRSSNVSSITIQNDQYFYAKAVPGTDIAYPVNQNHTYSAKSFKGKGIVHINISFHDPNGGTNDWMLLN